MKTLLITGANRGIGFQLAKEYLNNGWSVIATCRELDRSPELSSLAKEYGDQLTIEVLDLGSKQQIDEFADRLISADTKLNLIINNAGFADKTNESIESIDYRSAEQCFKINSLGALYFIHRALPLLFDVDSATIAIVSSYMGSLTAEQETGWYGYRMSKAAANMLTVNLAQELQPKNIAVVSMHPGWVKTDMGGESAPLSIEASAAGIFSVLNGISIAGTGKFLRYDGTEIPY